MFSAVLLVGLGFPHLYAAPDSDTNTAVRDSALAESAREAEEGLKRAEESGSDRDKCLYLLELGYVKLQKQEYKNAQDYFHEALNVAGTIRDSVLLAKVYTHLSYIYTELEVHYKAIEYLNRACDYYRANGEYAKWSANLYNLGLLYSEEQQYDEAVRCFKKSLAVTDDLASFELGITYSELGAAYLGAGVLDSASLFLEKADSIYDNSGNRYSKHFLYRVLYLEQAENNPDLSLLDSAVHYARKEKNIGAESDALIRVAEILMNKGNLKQAYEITVKAVEASQISDRTFQLFKASKLAAELSDRLGLSSEARKYGETAFNAAQKRMERDKEKVSLYADLRRSRTDNEQLQESLSLLEKQKEMNKKQLRLRNTFLWMIGVFGVITLGGLIYLSVLYLRNKKVLRENKEVLFIAGHDIRSPLAQLQSTLELIDDGALDQSSKEYLLKNIRDNLNRSMATIDEILGWAKSEMDQKKVTFSENTIKDAVEKAMAYNNRIIELKKVNIKTQINPDHQVFCNRDHLEIILRNLISNAVKFSEEKGDVEIKSQSDRDHVCVVVKDYGKGMNEETKKNLFGSIVTNKGKKNKGVGIGLFLSYQFIKRNKGDISVKSEPGKGSTFTLSFPKRNS